LPTSEVLRYVTSLEEENIKQKQLQIISKYNNGNKKYFCY